MSTMVRVPVQLKEQVEKLQSRFHSKSQADVIESLIRSLEAYDHYRSEQSKKWQDEKERQKNEDIHVGSETKNRLIDFQNFLGLKSPAQAIEFLIDVFDSSHSINKLAFLNFVEMKKAE